MFADFCPYNPYNKPMLGSSFKVKGVIVVAGHDDKCIGGQMSTGKLLVDYFPGRKSFLPIKLFRFDWMETNQSITF